MTHKEATQTIKLGLKPIEGLTPRQQKVADLRFCKAFWDAQRRGWEGLVRR